MRIKDFIERDFEDFMIYCVRNGYLEALKQLNNNKNMHQKILYELFPYYRRSCIENNLISLFNTVSNLKGVIVPNSKKNSYHVELNYKDTIIITCSHIQINESNNSHFPRAANFRNLLAQSNPDQYTFFPNQFDLNLKTENYATLIHTGIHKLETLSLIIPDNEFNTILDRLDFNPNKIITSDYVEYIEDIKPELIEIDKQNFMH